MPTVLTSDPRSVPSLDTSVHLVTPERVEFRYTLAGPFRRSLAYLIDVAVMSVLVILGYLFSSLVTFGQLAGLGPVFVIYFATTWGYGAFCETVFDGRTVGKFAIGVRVVTVEGVPITGFHAVVRNLIGTFDGPAPFLYMTGLATMILTSRFQRLGDLAAGTMVVVQETRQGTKVPRVEKAAIARVLVHLPLRVSAGSEMARALSDYVRHRPRFRPERREEIARHLARPLRERYALPGEATSDAILCAFYHRLFLGE